MRPTRTSPTTPRRTPGTPCTIPYRTSGTTYDWMTVGGTSAGAPQWAAILAIADQGRAAAGQAALDSTSPQQVMDILYQNTGRFPRRHRRHQHRQSQLLGRGGLRLRHRPGLAHRPLGVRLARRHVLDPDLVRHARRLRADHRDGRQLVQRHGHRRQRPGSGRTPATPGRSRSPAPTSRPACRPATPSPRPTPARTRSRSRSRPPGPRRSPRPTPRARPSPDLVRDRGQPGRREPVRHLRPRLERDGGRVPVLHGHREGCLRQRGHRIHRHGVLQQQRRQGHAAVQLHIHARPMPARIPSASLSRRPARSR